MHQYIELERLTPRDWSIYVVAFAVGVKGTSDEPAWTAALEELDIPQARHAKIVAKAIDETLEACFSITEARMALLQGGSSTRIPPPKLTNRRGVHFSTVRLGIS